MADAHIVGWGHTRFGRLDGRSLEDLIIEAAREAIGHAAVSAADIDAIWIGKFNSGLTPEGIVSSLAPQTDPRLRFVPATRVENACASGAAAIYAARDSIRFGLAPRSSRWSSARKR
jgi:acetyl-CoA C-acetyltransferase